MLGYAKYAFQGGEETRGLGSISPDIKVKRSETPLAGITFRRLHLRLERSLRGAKLKEGSKNAILPQPTPCVLPPDSALAATVFHSGLPSRVMMGMVM